MANIDKVAIPNGTTYNIIDSRISGITSLPADADTDVMTSDGSYNNLVGCDVINESSSSTEIESKALEIKTEYLNSMLAQAPKILARGTGNSKVYEIQHPLINYPGAECVLVRYCRKNGKLRKGQWVTAWGRRGLYKKGFSVVKNFNWPSLYFDFLEYSTLESIRNFFIGVSSNRSFGIVFRVPNPNYNGPTTDMKNANYKGTREMLWSDITRIKVSGSGVGIFEGIGLT